MTLSATDPLVSRPGHQRCAAAHREYGRWEAQVAAAAQTHEPIESPLTHSIKGGYRRAADRKRRASAKGDVMRRITTGILVMALLAAVPAAAEPKRAATEPKRAPAVKSSSTNRRVLWTVIGAGAGFAAGTFIGFNKFDQALYAERKIWTTAIVGAAAGGVAGALLSRNTSRSVPIANAVRPAPTPDVSWAEALHRPPAPTAPAATR
jgi:hypothetical protein